MANTNGQLTSLAASKTFAVSGGDVAVPDDAVAVLLQAETQNVRFRVDGTAPTTAVGLILIAGDAPIRLDGRDAMRNLKVIEVAASAKLNYCFVVS